jgi:hypothetical protein
LSEWGNSAERADKSKVTITAKIDQRAMSALDRVAKAYGVSSAQFMVQFFDDMSDAVEFLDSSQGGGLITFEDWFAQRIVERWCRATPEELRAVGRVWDRAAELKAQQGGAK